MEMRIAAVIATICPQVIANGIEMALFGKNEKIENVPRMRTKPVAIVATDAGLAMTNHVQA